MCLFILYIHTPTQACYLCVKTLKHKPLGISAPKDRYTHRHIYIYIYTYICPYLYVDYTLLNACKGVCEDTRTHLCINMCISIYIYIDIHVCVFVFIYIYIYIQIYIYIYVHTYSPIMASDLWYPNNTSNLHGSSSPQYPEP